MRFPILSRQGGREPYFIIDFGTQSGANLAPSWASLLQDMTFEMHKSRWTGFRPSSIISYFYKNQSSNHIPTKSDMHGFRVINKKQLRLLASGSCLWLWVPTFRCQLQFPALSFRLPNIVFFIRLENLDPLCPCIRSE